MAKNPDYHKRTKHIDICCHFVQEKVEDGQVELDICPTQDMLADINDEATGRYTFISQRTKLGIEGVADKFLKRLSCAHVATEVAYCSRYRRDLKKVHAIVVGEKSARPYQDSTGRYQYIPVMTS